MKNYSSKLKIIFYCHSDRSPSIRQDKLREVDESMCISNCKKLYYERRSLDSISTIRRDSARDDKVFGDLRRISYFATLSV
jgi:hypothetical protein